MSTRPLREPVRTRPSFRLARAAAAAGLVLGLLALVAAPALAQRAGRKAADPERRLAHLTERLHLSEDQQGRVRPILEDEAGELRAAVEKARASGDRDGLREQIRAIRTRNDERLEAELDDPQKQSFHALRQEQHERVRQRKAQGGAGRPSPP